MSWTLSSTNYPIKKIEALVGQREECHHKNNANTVPLSVCCGSEWPYRIFYNSPNFYNISGTVILLEYKDIEISDYFLKLETFLGQQRKNPRD
jgi:hypothetical protein